MGRFRAQVIIVAMCCGLSGAFSTQDNTHFQTQEDISIGLLTQSFETNDTETYINEDTSEDIDLSKYSLLDDDEDESTNTTLQKKKVRYTPFSFSTFRDLNSTVTECLESSSDDFPKDLFTLEQKRHGAIILHFLLGIYCFALLAVVCNDYFLPSVEEICKKLDLSEDVAAATFMAIATSAPEFFVNIVGTFVTESDIGVGTIVGSAMFNTLGVAALGGIAAGNHIKLDWWPITRDSLIYVGTISMLVIMCNDELIQWYESLILLIFYVVYFVIMWQNKRIYKVIMKIPNLFNVQSMRFTNESIGTMNSAISIIKVKDPENPVQENLPQPEDTPLCLWVWPEGTCVIKVWWIFSWPVRLLLFCTIPDCRKHPKWYPITFIMCVVWIGSNSYVVSWMIAIIGNTIQIPDFVMGLTFLAAGGCLPEAISIVIVCKRGQGGMGVSNSLGANTLDILLCLGFPWFVKTMINSTNQESYAIPMSSDSLFYTIIALILAVVVLYVVVSFNGFKLNKKVGYILILFYLGFLAMAISLEMFLLYDGKLLPCES